ncbi:SWIM zinc finger family protein [Streptomyces sp. NPDC001843]|uniref:SWIM zinc finger family protein n=1 Tax=Streptomyces sp. NPDC001843 TaxID=3364617 RepID=UPI00368D2024
MTGGTVRPADAARRALREARERRGGAAPGECAPTAQPETPDSPPGAPAAPEAPGGAVRPEAGVRSEAERSQREVRVEPSAPGDACRVAGQVPEVTVPEGSQAPEGAIRSGETADERLTPRPSDAARAALRSAVAARRGAELEGAGSTPRGDFPGPPEDAVPETGERTAPLTAPGGRGAAGQGGRPGDVARDALRAARRAARESAADTGTPEADSSSPRRSPRAAAAPARRPALSPAERSERARDMREFLATAFRMPTMSDEPDGPGETADTGDPAAGTAAPAPPAGLPDRAPTPDTPAHSDTPTPQGGTPQRPPAPTPPESPAPPPPPVPHTMATPHRDHDLRRTFPAFPPRSPQDGRFAETWWGNAWADALEEGALDIKRLARGRGYAEQGHVDAITVTPGLVLAYVRGSRPRPYRVQVRLRTLEEADWERFLDAAADRPGHIAALLDKELPHSLADCGVPLLPGPGDLAPYCSCPDSGHPCKHAAALCYQTARLLDADPFVLLLLRGRGERDLLDALSRRSATRAARAARERQPESLPGVRATEVLTPRELPPLPPPLPVPPHPQQPPVYPAAPGGPDPFALDQLATDAAARAHALLTTGRDPVGELTLWQDAVRQAAARPGSGLTAATRTLYSALAAATGRTPADLARAVAAWRQGGLDGLTVLEEPWDPPAGRFDRARPLLLAADLPAFRPWRNHLTHPRGDVQLRFGRDGLWYAYESEPGRNDWWPRGTPDLDPVGALTGLGASHGM